MHPEIVAMLGTDPLPMFICGAWASNSSDAPIPIYDPANGEELCKVVSSDLPMLDSAINSTAIQIYLPNLRHSKLESRFMNREGMFRAH